MFDIGQCVLLFSDCISSFLLHSFIIFFAFFLSSMLNFFSIFFWRVCVLWVILGVFCNSEVAIFTL